MNARESAPRTRSLPSAWTSRILQPILPKRSVGRAVVLTKAGIFILLTVICHLSSVIGLFAVPVPENKPPTYPAWWFEREVIKRTNPSNENPIWPTLESPSTDYLPSDDFAVLNQGQLKNLATKAYAELKDKLPGQPWATVDTPAYKLEQLVLGWYLSYPNTPQTIGTDPFAVANQGQLKNVAVHFYDVLAAVGYVGGRGLPPDTSGFPWSSGSTYPWTVSVTDDDSYATANLGQAKRLFSFDLASFDSEPDGMPDYWEQQIIQADNNDAITNVADVLPGDDFDGDGLNNLQEYLNHTNPTQADSNHDGLTDKQNIAMGLDPMDLDLDDDGISNADELAAQTNPYEADTDHDGVPDGSDAFPLDPTRSEPLQSNPNDSTPPEITLVEPIGALPIN